jgi:hypothetical protein
MLAKTAGTHATRHQNPTVKAVAISATMSALPTHLRARVGGNSPPDRRAGPPPDMWMLVSMQAR